MTISLAECQELLALASTIDTFAGSAEMVRHMAEALRTWTGARLRRAPTAPAPEPAQLELLGLREPAPVAPEPTAHGSSRTYQPAPEPAPEPPRSETRGSLHTCDAAPSSTSSDDLYLREKSEPRATERPRTRPTTDEPIPDDFRAVAEEAAKERAVRLPSADFLWASFVEFLWAEDVSFAKRWNLKRRWRKWCWTERPLEDARAANAPPPATATREALAAEVADEEAARVAVRTRLPLSVRKAQTASISDMMRALEGRALPTAAAS